MENKKAVKNCLLVATYALVLYFLLTNYQSVFSLISRFLGILSPFLFGICLAFVLNLFMRFLEEKPIAFLERKTKKKLGKFKRPISIVLSFLFLILVLTALILFVIPQLTKSVKMLVSSMPFYLNALEAFINMTMAEWGIDSIVLDQIAINWGDIIQKVGTFIANTIPHLLNITVSITTSIFNMFMGIIIAIYLLASKENLITNVKRVLYAFLPRKVCDKTVYVGSKLNESLGNFISGQLIEACIIGTLCFIGMTIFQMPYALLVSVIVSITALIPIFGAYIGAFGGAFIIVMVKPISAIWFLIFIVCLQQFEGSVIYPRVVGGSIGLGGLWVMFALIVAGSFFGLPGMLIGIPVFAVLYSLLSLSTRKRLTKKGLIVHTAGPATDFIPQPETKEEHDKQEGTQK